MIDHGNARKSRKKGGSQKGKYKPQYTWSIPIVPEEKTVFSKRQSKNVKVVEREFTIGVGDTFIVVKLSDSTNDVFKESGIAEFATVTTFRK